MSEAKMGAKLCYEHLVPAWGLHFLANSVSILLQRNVSELLDAWFI